MCMWCRLKKTQCCWRLNARHWPPNYYNDWRQSSSSLTLIRSRWASMSWRSSKPRRNWVMKMSPPVMLTVSVAACLVWHRARAARRSYLTVLFRLLPPSSDHRAWHPVTTAPHIYWLPSLTSVGRDICRSWHWAVIPSTMWISNICCLPAPSSDIGPSATRKSLI